MRIAYLGPAGTFTEDALGEALGDAEFEPLRTDTVFDAILAVIEGRADRALAPYENSIEGSVRGTLDILAFDAPNVSIVGEHDYPVRQHLIVRDGVELEQIEAVLSHQQGLAQTARFLRENLPGVELRSVSSTAAAVRMVSESPRPWAAIGARAAAPLYGCQILREGIQDEANNVTRFVWVAPAGTEPGIGDAAGKAWKTSLIFSELGEDKPGALVDGAERVLLPRDQPLADRVAAAALPTGALFLLRRRRRQARGRARRGRRSRPSEARRNRSAILGSYPLV